MDEIPKFEDTLPIEQASQPTDEAPPKFEDTQPMPENSEVPKFEDTQPIEKYETMGQQAGTFLEGTAQGFAGPLATYAEQKLSDLGVPNMTDEDIRGRQAANPGLHAAGEFSGLAGGFMTGIGEAGLIAKGLNVIPKGAGFFAKIGSSVIKNAIQMGAIKGGDEISKSLLGQGDPNDAVGSALVNMGAASLIGAVTGGVFATVGEGAQAGLKAIEKTKLGNKLTSFMAGMGYAAKSPTAMVGEPASEEAALSGLPPGLEIANNSWFEAGKKAYGTATHSVLKRASQLTGESIGLKEAGIPGVIVGDQVGKYVGRILDKNLSSASQKYIGPAIYRALSTGAYDNISETLNYATKLSRGAQSVNNAVESLFKAGGNIVVDVLDAERENEKLNACIKDDSLNKSLQQENMSTPGFSEGGQVDSATTSSGGLSEHLPEHNVLLNAAKARVFSYLKSQQPAPLHNKRAFDEDHKDTEQEHKYNRLLTLANRPLSVLNHIKDGSLLPQHVHALTNMYPEIHTLLNKKLMEKIVEEVHEKRKPPYHVRQALSLFMGQDLDSSLTPQNIMAAQNVFARLNAQKQAVSAQKALPKMGENSVTPDQSRERRLNKS